MRSGDSLLSATELTKDSSVPIRARTVNQNAGSDVPNTVGKLEIQDLHRPQPVERLAGQSGDQADHHQRPYDGTPPGDRESVLERLGHLPEGLAFLGRGPVEVLLPHEDRQGQGEQDHPGAGQRHRERQVDQAERTGRDRAGDLRGQADLLAADEHLSPRVRSRSRR